MGHYFSDDSQESSYSSWSWAVHSIWKNSSELWLVATLLTLRHLMGTELSGIQLLATLDSRSYRKSTGIWDWISKLYHSSLNRHSQVWNQVKYESSLSGQKSEWESPHISQGYFVKTLEELDSFSCCKWLVYLFQSSWIGKSDWSM